MQNAKLQSKAKSLLAHKSLFYLIVALLPLGLAKHWAGDFSYVNGILVDYLMPAFYATDFLVLWLLVWVLVENTRKGKWGKENIKERRLWAFLFSFLLFSFCSLISVPHAVPAVYRFVKIGEGVFLFFYTTRFISRRDFPQITRALSVAVIWSSLLGLYQFVFQRTLFGYFPFGETQFQLYNPAVAKISVFGHLLVRAYGPFPHPNVFAGFLAISLCVVLSASCVVRRASRLSFLALCLGIPALLLTFSRTGLVATVLLPAACIFSHLRGDIKITAKKSLVILGGLVVSGALWGLMSYGARGGESFLDRVALAKEALILFLKHPWFGVGLNQFSLYATRFRFQPVHNIFLLILSESGVFALFAFLAFSVAIASKAYRSKNALGLVLLAELLVFGLADHYFFTTQPGILLFWLTLGLVLIYTRSDG